MRRTASAAILGVLSVGLGLIAFDLARGEPSYAPGGADVGAALVGSLGGWAIALAGLLAWRADRGFGPALALAGPAWLIAACASPATSSAVLFTAALVFAHAALALIAHATLVDSPARRLLVGVVYVACIGVAGLAATALFDPVAEGCPDCPDNLVAVASDPEAQLTVTRWGLAAAAAGLAAVVVALLVQLRRSSPVRRLRDAPLLLSGAVFVALSAAQLAHGVSRGFVSNDDLDRRLWLGQAVALLLLAAATGWDPLRRRRARTQLARLVVELGDAPRPGGLRDALADALGDPGLQLLYKTDETGWVRPDGTATEPPGDEATQLVSGNLVVGALVHRPGLLDDPALREELSSAARLAFDHERLQAAARRQLADLRASRARVVAAGDAERRRLERDLHDGAQQRLVGLAISLGLARRTARADADDLAWAEHELRTAVAELRELAHGIYPAVLSEEGLAAALETLAEGEPRLRLFELCDERLPEPVESAAYVMVARAVRAGGNGRVEVRTARGDRSLTVSVRTGGDVQEIEDRVGALYGTLAVADDGALVAHLPVP
jgi:signal transduction histidine kinase